MAPFSGQIIIDADWTAEGWEIVARFGAEDMIEAWSGVKDADLPTIIGPTAAAQFIRERDA